MTLKIQVSADYRITSDPLNFIVERRHLVDPSKSPNRAALEAAGKSMAIREDWREAAYFSTLEKALKWTVNQRIRESDAQGTGASALDEIIAEIKRIHGEIDALRMSEGIR
jgi:hypothetical protein